MELLSFNQTISIEIEVDDIAKKLLSTFPEEYAHRNLVVNAIIGTAVNNGSIGYIYNALNGYSPEVDFTVGQKVFCSYQGRRENECDLQLVDPVEVKAAKPTVRKRNMVEIGECEVVEIDLYRPDRLRVLFMQDSYYADQPQEKTTAWVSHKTCTGISEVELAH